MRLVMSIRDQERRQKESERRINERTRLADKHVLRGNILARQKKPTAGLGRS